MLVLNFKSFVKALCRTWFVASFHPLYHNLVIGSMCSSLHVSYPMVGCLVLISFIYASYMLFTLWFFSWHLFFCFLSSLCHEFNIYGTFLICCSKQCASLQGIQKLVCTIWGGVYPICCDHETNMPWSLYLLSLMECIWISPRRYASMPNCTSNSYLNSYIC